MQPLRGDWANAQARRRPKRRRRSRQRRCLVRAFHERLCETRILDPACGTGNFLYVALELMKPLEGEVLEALAALGGQEPLTWLGHTVDPHQFLGLELNPRAAAIAELVLWIGYLQWHYRNHEGIRPSRSCAPFQHSTCATRRLLDAVTWPTAPSIARTDAEGKTSRSTPIKSASAGMAGGGFIVGNPPFMGGKDVRSRLAPTMPRPYGPPIRTEQQRRFRYVLVGSRRRTFVARKDPAKPLRSGHHKFDQPGVSRRTIERYLTAKAPI